MTDETYGRYTVADVETTISNDKVGKLKASSFSGGNTIVVNAYRYEASSYDEVLTSDKEPTAVLPATPLLVGHNFKFDIHHYRAHHLRLWERGASRRKLTYREWVREGGKIWDTQAAAYIISGQSELYPKLDDEAVKYGGAIKDDRIKALWESGVNTDDIPRKMLIEYAEGDIVNTEKVFLGQIKVVAEQGQTPLMNVINDAILAFEEMEFNGMSLDTKQLHGDATNVQLSLRNNDDNIKSYVGTDYEHINIDSNQQLSVLLFGGRIPYTTRVPDGKYKTGKKKGQPKFKNVEEYLVCRRMVDPNEDWFQKKHKLGHDLFKTSDDVLATIVAEGTSGTGGWSVGLAKTVRERRGMVKEYKSYYLSLPNLVHDDGLLHQNINTCATATGRLSENEPNLQNVSTSSDSMIKKSFVSRWGDEGVIMEADYSQLEIICLAYLSGDEQLQEDILLGRDIHDETMKVIGHLLPTHLSEKEKRRIVKGVNFGIVYGGGATTLSKQGGISVSLTKEIIKVFHRRYPMVKVWNAKVMREVRDSATFHGDKTDKGKPALVGKHISPTGRQYTFKQYDAYDWIEAQTGEDTMFSLPQVANYPVQGFATGDIVPMVCGILFRRLLNSEYDDKALLINTVHDSIVLDVKKEVVEEVAELVKGVMESAPAHLKLNFGINFELPLNVEVTWGDNWKDQEEKYED